VRYRIRWPWSAVPVVGGGASGGESAEADAEVGAGGGRDP
jgi:hypothetical protein